MKPRTLQRIPPGRQSEHHHNVYVVLLDPAAGKIVSVRAPMMTGRGSTARVTTGACQRPHRRTIWSPLWHASGDWTRQRTRLRPVRNTDLGVDRSPSRGQPTMSAIDTEILAMFNALNPTRQGKLLDLLGQLIDEQDAEQYKEPAQPVEAAK